MASLENELLQTYSLCQQGKRDAALQMYRSIKITNQKDHVSHNKMGLIAMSLHLLSEAIEYFEKAIQVHPKEASYWNHLGLARLKHQQFEHSLKAFNQALKIDKKNPISHHNLGVYHEHTNQLDLAESCFREEIRLNPKSLNGIYALALLLERRGELEEAKKMLITCIEKNPQLIDAHVLLGSIHRRKKNYDQAALHLDTALSINKNSVKALFELGHLQEAQKKYDDALKTFTQANTQQNRHQVRREQFEKEMQELEGFLNSLPDNPQKKSSCDNQLPLFIVGSPRSGTTLLAQMLGMHPDLYNGGELQLLPQVYQQANTLLNNPRNIARILHDLYFNDPQQEITQSLRKFFLENLFQLKKQFKLDEVNIIDKLPSNVRRLPLISKIIPQAGIIHIIRDGREVSWSAFTQNFRYDVWHSHSPETALMEWEWNIKLSRLCQKKLPLHYLEIKYEDLIDTPEKTIRTCLDHLGLNWESACLEFYKDTKTIGTASYHQVKQTLYRSSLHKSANYKDLYSQMTKKAFSTLSELGYI